MSDTITKLGDVANEEQLIDGLIYVPGSEDNDNWDNWIEIKISMKELMRVTKNYLKLDDNANYIETDPEHATECEMRGSINFVLKSMLE